MVAPPSRVSEKGNPAVQGGVLFFALLLPTSVKTARQVDRCRNGRSANHKEAFNFGLL